MLRNLAILGSFALAAQAATFNFGATIQAGQPIFLGDELALGTSAASPVVTGSVFIHHPDNSASPFSLSYNGATNTATLAATGLLGVVSSISWNPAGGAPGIVPRTWTINPGGLGVAASGTPVATTVQIAGLSLTGAGLSVLQPLTTTTLTASQPGGSSASGSNGSAVVFTTPGAGSWMLSGTIRFAGLFPYDPAGASGNELRMALDINAADAPEPATLLLIGLGFALLGVVHARRRAERASAPATSTSLSTSPKPQPAEEHPSRRTS